jgi:hypothetical protein
MNSCRLFELKRKLDILNSVEGFYVLHSQSYGRKKRQKQGEKEKFFSQLKTFI